MALAQCKECGCKMSSSAAACPNCGAKIKKTSLFTKLVAGFFVFTAIMMYFGHQSNEEYKTKKATADKALQQEEQKRIAALTPAQKAEAEKKRLEQIKAEGEAELLRLGLKWVYQESDDNMGRGKIKTAQVNSIREFEFSFPYKGLQRANLELRKHPEQGKSVLLSIETGQFLCDFDGCNVQVRFGNSKVETFSASGPSDHSTTLLFIRDYDRFVSDIKKVDRVSIEALFYREGNRVFEFDVSGLKWS